MAHGCREIRLMDNSSAFQKLRQFADETSESGDIKGYVQEKKIVMRSNKQFVDVARAMKKKESATFDALKQGLKKSGKINDPVFSCWDKYLKGR